ncbi:MAG: low temperature requirement protein A [Actinomycetota bacterium]
MTRLELFFDLVFVFAITQVTGFLADDPTWGGLLRGLMLLGALWWAWALYAWMTNTLNPEEGAVRLAVFGAMAAMLIVSLAVPNAFGTDGVAFGVAYFIVHDPVARGASPGQSGAGPRRARAGRGRMRGPDRLRGTPLPACARLDPEPTWGLHHGGGRTRCKDPRADP